MEQQIRFCTASDGVRIAYAVAGSGYPLVWIPGWLSHAEIDWDIPILGDRYHDLTKDFKLFRLDKRGTGLSTRGLPSYSREDWVRDVEAVVEHAKLKRFALAGYSEGGPIAVEYATLHPRKLSHLILLGTGVVTDDEDREGTLKQRELVSALVTIIRTSWGSAVKMMSDFFLGEDAPLEAQKMFASYQRQAANAEDAAKMLTAAPDTYEIAHLAPKVRVPTIVIHGRSDVAVPIEFGQQLAAMIPGARFKSVEGHHVPGRKQSLEMQAAICEFVLGVKAPVEEPLHDDRAFDRAPSGTAIILFADIADSTALTERLGDAAFREKARELDGALRQAITSSGGTAIDGKLLGDGVLATFGAAREAIACAMAIHRMAGSGVAGRGSRLEGQALLLHVGIHAGDVIREDNNVYGGAVNIAARVAGEAAAGETLVSQTVRDLARTSAGVSFQDRGERTLKGIDEKIRLWAVREATDAKK